MSPKARTLCALVLLLGIFFSLLFGSASADAPEMTIHLRRGAFDPLHSTDIIAPSFSAQASSQLMLIQLSSAPNSETSSQLAAAGFQPLAYIPDNTYLVRATTAPARRIASLSTVRWSGPYVSAYKLPVELDQLLSTSGIETVDLRLLATLDANIETLTQDLKALGAVILSRGDTLNGPTLRLQLPTAALPTVIARDDVLWVEQYIEPSLLDDRANGIMAVESGRQQFGLDGRGQIIAIADTGLDVQADVQANANPDLPAARIARAFTQHEMNATCSENNWSDARGHGTHVAGIIAGSGANSPEGSSFGGVAPAAKLVVQAGSANLSCLDVSNTSYLQRAYDAGARVQNASWGLSSSNGAYDELARITDDFLWTYKEYLLVVAAGNNGKDSDKDGVIDADSINSPATAKNVLSVGASENDRAPDEPCSFSGPEGWCWDVFGAFGVPISKDPISDNPNGVAAFSSRGPTDDGRIKPEIVAPGTNIISTRSHMPSASYPGIYNDDYAYNSGTSMATPMISGMAALVRQWLDEERGLVTPSAALVKALLLNGAATMGPGQYGTGDQREIPAAWPNAVVGWGRANLAETVGFDEKEHIWLWENTGIQTSEVVSYTFAVQVGKPLRVTLAWTDYPAAPEALKTLVNDLDLDVIAPDGKIVRGNASADLPQSPVSCRVGGYDRCNNVESVEIAAPVAGQYTLRVRGTVAPFGPQPFALVARAAQTVAGQTPDDQSRQLVFLPIVSNG